MKRIIIFLLVAAMLFSAVACTKNDGKKPTDTTPETPKEPEFIIDPNDPVMTDILNSKIKLHFNSNGEFRVLILSDLHLKPASLTGSMRNSLLTLLDREQPDLVIMTGDNVYGHHVTKRDMFEKTIRQVADYLEEREIPWMHVYGNHDDEGILSREEQQAIYESFEHCISKSGEDLTGVGNYAIPLYASDSDSLKFVFWALDSGTYVPEEEREELFAGLPTYEGYPDSVYDYIHQDQIDWYKNASEKIEAANNGVKVPGLMAFHIPLQEAYYGWLEKDTLEHDGERREPVCASRYNSGLFDAILERGDVKAVAFGHDHVNNFMVNYKGVKLCYSGTFTHNEYNDEDIYGSRMFVIKESDPSNVETYLTSVAYDVDPSEVETFENGQTENYDSFTPEFDITGYDYATDSSYFIDKAVVNIVNGVGVGGSKAIGIKRVERSTETEVRWNLETVGKIGDNKYMMVWMDLSKNSLDFRDAAFGLIGNNGLTNPYSSRNYGACSFYFKADESNEWVTMNCSDYGFFGSLHGSSVNKLKGWFAFPIEYMRNNKGQTISDNTIITGVYFAFKLNKTNMVDKYLYIDNVSFVSELK